MRHAASIFFTKSKVLEDFHLEFFLRLRVLDGVHFYSVQISGLSQIIYLFGMMGNGKWVQFLQHTSIPPDRLSKEQRSRLCRCP